MRKRGQHDLQELKCVAAEVENPKFTQNERQKCLFTFHVYNGGTFTALADFRLREIIRKGVGFLLNYSLYFHTPEVCQQIQ